GIAQEVLHRRDRRGLVWCRAGLRAGDAVRGRTAGTEHPHTAVNPGAGPLLLHLPAPGADRGIAVVDCRAPALLVHVEVAAVTGIDDPGGELFILDVALDAQPLGILPENLGGAPLRRLRRAVDRAGGALGGQALACDRDDRTGVVAAHSLVGCPHAPAVRLSLAHGLRTGRRGPVELAGRRVVLVRVTAVGG